MSLLSPASIRLAGVADAARVSAIYNHYVRTSTCTWALREETELERARWLDEHDADHPVTVAEVDGRVVGWAALSTFRSRGGYRHTVEDSIYLDPQMCGRGLGSRLLADLIARARALGHHLLVAGVSADQDVSIRLHRKFGFREVGRFTQIGRKFDRWLDGVFLELLL